MTSNENTLRFWCAFFSVAIGGTAVAIPPSPPPEPSVDTLVVRAPEAAAQAAPARLIAPEIVAEQIELEPTVVPSEFVAQRIRRLSDQNADGIVDAQDVAAITAQMGACPNGTTGCVGDLNRDGRVDETDVELVRRQLGNHAAGATEAFPERVGYSVPAPAGLFPRFPAQLRGDGRRVARLELHSIDAAGLRLQITGLAGADGLELRIYDPSGAVVLGPYVNPRCGQDGTWWTPIIFGDAIGMEVTLAPGRDAPLSMPSISQVMHFVCNEAQCHSGPGTALACHNDLTCNASWAGGDGRGVALIYFNSGGGCVRCSGALLNRGPGDLSPLFMTANHCVNTQAEADTLEVLWNYTTPTCNGTPPNYNTLLRSDGAILLKRHPGADWSLLGLLEAPQTNVYVGWDPNNWAAGGAATGIHHPRGTFKRISTGTSAGTTDAQSFCDTATPPNCFNADVFDVALTNGTTEPGSSGSPVFDSNRHVRGALTGGLSGCAPITAQYGRLDRAFANLRYFLSDADVPSGVVFVNGTVGGDLGNAGSTERGTAANPFNGVAEATFCVRSGQEVRISPGGYNEQFTILRPMVLTRNSSGVVRIGSN